MRRCVRSTGRGSKRPAKRKWPCALPTRRVLLDASSMLLDGFSTLLDVQRATRRSVFLPVSTRRVTRRPLLDASYSTLLDATRRYSTSLLDVLFSFWTWAKGPTRRLTRRPTRRFLTRRPTRRYSTSYSTVFLSLRSSSLFAHNISRKRRRPSHEEE